MSEFTEGFKEEMKIWKSVFKPAASTPRVLGMMLGTFVVLFFIIFTGMSIFTLLKYLAQ